MIEKRPIPAIAMTAMALLQREFDARADAIGRQTIEVLGLKEEENWTCDFAAGEISREVPDPAPVPPGAQDG